MKVPSTVTSITQITVGVFSSLGPPVLFNTEAPVPAAGPVWSSVLWQNLMLKISTACASDLKSCGKTKRNWLR